eukprot:scaffold22942_cov64-Phaeocystis_antarctica.AAC.5
MRDEAVGRDGAVGEEAQHRLVRVLDGGHHAAVRRQLGAERTVLEANARQAVREEDQPPAAAAPRR